MTIGDRIRSARKNAGMTQAQLAEKSGVAAISIHQYEAGKRQPRLEQLIRISSALNVDMLDITGLESEMSEYRFELTKAGNGEATSPNEKNLSMRDIYSLLSSDEKIEFWGRLMKPLQAKLNEAFSKLNQDGQQEAVKRVEELTEIRRYCAETAPQDTPPSSEGNAPNAPETPPEGE